MKFPYSNFHDLNTDWIIKKIKELTAKVDSIGSGSGTSDFNQLSNRPSYNSHVMTNATNVPLVKTAIWDAKQDALVSGTNIKTVNSNSLLGAGDVTLTASDVGALASNTTYVSSFNGNSGAINYTAPVTSVNGSTGAVVLDADDIAYSSSASYSSDTVGKAIQNLESLRVVNSANGSIASFSDGAALNAVDVKCEINPVQDLHGQDNPYPAGGGKNLLPLCNESDASGIKVTRNGDGSLTFSGTAESSVAINLLFFDLPAGDYLFSNAGSTVTATGSTATVYVRDNTNSVTLTNVAVGNTANGASFTLTATTNIRFYVVAQLGAALSGTLYPMIRLSTESDYSYAPYSNICPISGWTGCNIYHEAEYDAGASPTLTVTWTDQGTIYGGTLDVTTGVLTKTHEYIASYNGETLPSTWISDRDAYAEGTTPTTGAEVVYKLATPITFQLSSNQLALLKGDNNVWAYTGDTSIDYYADLKLYIDQSIAAAIAAI